MITTTPLMPTAMPSTCEALRRSTRSTRLAAIAVMIGVVAL